jgi:hypothetical protein
VSGMVVAAAPGTYEHGTQAKYALERCHCVECRAANNAARRTANRQRAYGRGGNVDAAAARAHVLALKADGMGYRRIAVAAGLSGKTVYILTAGRSERGTRPPVQIRRSTSEAILSVRFSPSPGQCITGEPVLRAWEQIADLMEMGHSKAWIASRVISTSARSLQLHRDRMEFRSIVKIARLHAVTRTAPRSTNCREAAVITRSHNAAGRIRSGVASRRAALSRGAAL